MNSLLIHLCTIRNYNWKNRSNPWNYNYNRCRVSQFATIMKRNEKIWQNIIWLVQYILSDFNNETTSLRKLDGMSYHLWLKGQHYNQRDSKIFVLKRLSYYVEENIWAKILFSKYMILRKLHTSVHYSLAISLCNQKFFHVWMTIRTWP